MLSILKSLLSVLSVLADVWFYFFKKRHTPGAENAARYEQSNHDIANHDSQTATAHANADLDELERLRRSK